MIPGVVNLLIGLIFRIGTSFLDWWLFNAFFGNGGTARVETIGKIGDLEALDGLVGWSRRRGSRCADFQVN